MGAISNFTSPLSLLAGRDKCAHGLDIFAWALSKFFSNRRDFPRARRLVRLVRRAKPHDPKKDWPWWPPIVQAPAEEATASQAIERILREAIELYSGDAGPRGRGVPADAWHEMLDEKLLEMTGQILS